LDISGLCRCRIAKPVATKKTIGRRRCMQELKNFVKSIVLFIAMLSIAIFFGLVTLFRHC
jgi:hypothetical protein